MTAHSPTTTITCLSPEGFEGWLSTASDAQRAWVSQQQFCAAASTSCLIPALETTEAQVLCGTGATPDMWSLAHLSAQLPAGDYTVTELPSGVDALWLMVGTHLAQYQFRAYKTTEAKPLASITLPEHPQAVLAAEILAAINHGRDLINHPANVMGPVRLSEEAEAVAKQFGAEFSCLVGDALLANNYPTIHMVGRAANEPARLIDIRWGNPSHPKVTLVGKGVTFDSGGLNIKTGNTMKLMKKDMGGAAAVLSLARMVMAAQLPIRLRVLIPAVENAISAGAMRPLDIVTTRKGLTVEVGDTDAEGRLILCDALAEADSESPDLLVDCATLTGASRVALGTEIPSFFTHNDALANQLQTMSFAHADPLWRLPLWDGYRDMLSSAIADTNNISEGGYGGAITAALFLDKFVARTANWVHIDMMAWNTSKRPGRPVGGEVMAARVLFAYLQQHYTPLQK